MTIIYTIGVLIAMGFFFSDWQDYLVKWENEE